jgi:tRNA pseudouridine38-40 synthase
MVTTPLWPASSSSEALSPSQGPEAGGPVEADRLFQVAGSLSQVGSAAVPERRRARLLVAYVGTGFHGFARQRGVTTVASALAGAVERVVRHPVELTCAGRTDSGVHAWGQVVSLDLVASADLERVQRSVNKMLAPAVVVREVQWAAAGFNARHSALSRRYRYTLSCSPWADPFTAATTWHVGVDLDVRGMQAACDPLLGVHDFTSFCHVPRDRPGPLVRRVLSADWSDLGQGYLRFEIEASSFCHQMVRSIVGLMVEVGLGRRKAGEVAAVVATRDRSAAGPLSPAHGLCLWEVKYGS